MSGEKTALFGGTFNPPHLGHVRAFKSFCDTLKADVVYVMPSMIPPHKQISPGDSPARRFNMAKLAFDGICENAVFSAIEISRSGKSYSIDTVNELIGIHSCEKIYMYVGSDMLFSFESWKNFRTLFEKCILVTAPRSESDEKLVRECCERYSTEYGCEYIILPLEPTDISSTAIRELAKSGGSSCADSLKKYLTADLYEYIMKERIYSKKEKDCDISAEKDISRVRDEISRVLSEKRLSHTFSVEKTALEMAEKFLHLYGFGKEYLKDISMAALLHDITKNRSDEWQKEYLYSFKRHFEEYPAVYHSWSGAYYALENYSVNERVFRAVYNHTTGRADMDIFEKIIFLADYIEPGRKHSACMEMREKYIKMTEKGVPDRNEAEKLLDSLMLEVLSRTKDHLSEKNAPVCPKLFEAIEFLKNRSCEV